MGAPATTALSTSTAPPPVTTTAKKMSTRNGSKGSAGSGSGNGLKKLFGRRNSKGGGSSNSKGNNNNGASGAGSSSHHVNAVASNEQIVRISSETKKSLASSRSARANKNKTGGGSGGGSGSGKGSGGNGGNGGGGGLGGRLRGLLPKKNPDQQEDSDRHSPSNPQTPLSSDKNGHQQQSHVLKISPKRENLFKWQDDMEQKESMAVIRQKQMVKERDGFCRRVDLYDGQVITVDNKATYELGNYLGGGVAGVVYEGHRLRPMDEYPVRLGINDGDTANGDDVMGTVKTVVVKESQNGIVVDSLLCAAACGVNEDVNDESTIQQQSNQNQNEMATRETSLLTVDSASVSHQENTVRTARNAAVFTEDMMALEATASGDQMVIIDTVDAPSRSKHYAKAVSMNNVDNDIPDDGSIRYGFMEETVAIKILNPVGFRTLSPSVTQDAVVARQGAALDSDIREGKRPMQEKHVWWLINPNSRNLRTLQRYAPTATSSSSSNRRIEVDRGSPEKGLRISLIAAYLDPRTGQLNELPLTKCIEIWGHVPFGATDDEFTHIMSAIDRVNAGLPPPPVPAFARMDGDYDPPGRVGTGGTGGTSIESGSMSNGMDDVRIGIPVAMQSKRTGIYRAAYSERSTVYCEELSAYIALPSVPSKYLKWLRQRRAATKEIRNMMLIGRHRNVVHLFEVLEHIQETKSTMFLILELVRGGELFDLISSNAAKITSNDKIPPGFTESETVMRKFFRELASGIHYCHSNSIAHRDLKPENLLVHNSTTGKCTLKIADFGLSAAFGPKSQTQTDQDTVVESIAPRNMSSMMSFRDDSSLLDSPPRSSPIKDSVEKILATGSRTLSFLTCGAVVDIIDCGPKQGDEDNGPSPLKRMTSVVGSPHYVAPEIISQTERSKANEGALAGYDGTKADVWSAGVILYAMLYRSLPFGEDLLRCPRYQSFRKWYDEVKRVSGRRSSAMAALNPIITETDERDFLGPHWFFPSETSPESRDLIVCMLNPDPDKRPTIQLVLQHPWILKQAT